MMMKNQWISLHIFYYGNQNQLLVSCIAPLIAQLRAQGLIQRYFFIKYWAEGPHIRLRLLPAVGADEEKIKYLSEAAITTFLKLRPALYSINHEKIAPIYKKLFIAEYGEAAWLTTYGEDGVMPLRPNNSFAYIPYIPETVRYGGPVAMELAEWHFEHSSDTVIGLLQQTNVGVHTMLLGRARQRWRLIAIGQAGYRQIRKGIAIASSMRKNISRWPLSSINVSQRFATTCLSKPAQSG
jgi:Lantibiotic biosynthesis dehydratase C-term